MAKQNSKPPTAGATGDVFPEAMMQDDGPAKEPGRAPETVQVSRAELEADKARIRNLEEQIAFLMRQHQNAASDLRPEEAEELHARDGDTPFFDPTEDYGTVVGDPEVGYVQGGHQFSLDRAYVRTEKNRGTSRPFNPRLVGIVKGPKIARE